MELSFVIEIRGQLKLVKLLCARGGEKFFRRGECTPLLLDSEEPNEDRQDEPNRQLTSKAVERLDKSLTVRIPTANSPTAFREPKQNERR